MDLHISVIADFKNIFPDIDITDWSLSGHTWVFNKHKHNHKHINERTWVNIDTKMIKAFQDEYDEFLQSFDGFICGHPNGFIPIYEKYNKPIIMINTCRYDLPYCISKNYEMLKFYNDCVKRIQEKGLLIAVSNNKADQKYTLLGCNILTTHIPSLCAYTGIRYEPTRTTFLCYTGNLPNHPLITKRSELETPFRWSDIGKFKGIIHIPYEISTMSMFEHYSAGIPLFFPSKQLMLEKYNITSISNYWGNHLPSEYNQMSTPSAWIDMADYYNVFNTPNIHYFDSFEHLITILETFVWKDDTILLTEYTENIRTSWSLLLKSYFSKETSMITKEDIITTDKYLSLESPTIAYIKTDVVYNGGRPIRWRGKNNGIRDAPIWITGHADYGITQAMHEKYSKHTTHWFTLNKEFDHPNLHSLPLGITNDCNDTHLHPILGNLDVMIEVMNMPREITNTAYMNFSIDTYPAERRSVFNLFKDKSWVTQEPFVPTYEGRKKFLQNIRNHRFVLCPRGNGVDTHRFWEALYMGSIPITVRHIAMEEFQDLPVCWINNWNEVTEPFLEAEFKRISEGSWNMEKLKFSYWRDRIHDKISCGT